MKSASVNIKQIPAMEFRFDPSLHLSEGVKVRETLAELPYEVKPLSSVTERIFLGNIFSRIWVKDKQHGVPYLAASDTVLANLDTGQFLAKRQAIEMPYLVLKKGWILVTCSGTLGNTSYTNGNYAGRIATHDLIRIVPNEDELPGGYVYAFLSSKYGYYQITQSQFGGVVKHINATQAGQIQIPVLPKEIVSESDRMIKESALLREKASDSLGKAQFLAEKKILIQDINDTNSVGIKKIHESHNIRFEASHLSSTNRKIYESIISQPFKTLGQMTNRIFRPGIFKRQYVENNGVPFLGGADILLAIPRSEKKLSFKQVEKMPELIVKPGWILITCGGTIGNVVIIDSMLSNSVISQHVMRIVPKDEGEVIFAFLSSKTGNKVINLFTYGSVIPSVENHHLELVPIPEYSSDEKEQIKSLIRSYVSANEKAKRLELEAISLVESEIEKWSK